MLRLAMRMIVALAFAAPILGEAQTLTWSGCQTITGVSNYIPYNGAFYISLSPGISGCTANTGNSTSAVGFIPGQLGVTSSNINSLLATGLTALSLGAKVMVYYDSSSVPQCNSQILAIHGYADQCP